MKTHILVVFAVPAMAQSWIVQQSGTDASLRGVSAVSDKVVWASGTKGTFLRTLDGGASWHAAAVAGAADLDFRGLKAFDERNAILLSAGDGEKSRVYKTRDGGTQWKLVLTNPDPKGFFDAIAFWDAAHGVLIGDPVDGRFAIFTTDDGGETWRREKGPAALEKEGAYAASNTCLIVRGTREAWFGTGGARVFHSTGGGRAWSAVQAPMRHDTASAGIFSLAFSDVGRMIAVGGDYTKPAEAAGNVAISDDGGKTWRAASVAPGGYRSAVAYIGRKKMWIATGTSGSDVSFDEGNTWKPFDAGNYNAMSFTSAGDGWAVGPKGAIARFKP